MALHKAEYYTSPPKLLDSPGHRTAEQELSRCAVSVPRHSCCCSDPRPTTLHQWQDKGSWHKGAERSQDISPQQKQRQMKGIQKMRQKQSHLQDTCVFASHHHMKQNTAPTHSRHKIRMAGYCTIALWSPGKVDRRAEEQAECTCESAARCHIVPSSRTTRTSHRPLPHTVQHHNFSRSPPHISGRQRPGRGSSTIATDGLVRMRHRKGSTHSSHH